MMSTVGVELRNFINPDLTWKTVSKGSRSSTRRTRKSVFRKLAVKMEQGSKNGTTAVEATVSDSEKAGVAILGRRFSEKVGHVPIKKRRLEYLSSSPPPPQTPSPHPELSEQHAHDQSTSDESLFNTSWGRGPSKVGDMMESNIEVDDRSFLYMNGKKCGIAEDFSGIEILAAAACSDSIAHDDLPSKSNSLMSESNQEHADSMISERLVETASASMQFDHPSAKALMTESKVDLSSPGCINIVPNETLCDKKSVESFVAVPEDRSLWDLNLTIDAWERPCACNDVALEKKSDVSVPDESKKFHIAEPNDVKVNSTLMMASSTNDAKCVYSRIFYAGTDCLRGEDKKVKEFSVLKRERDGEPVSVGSNQDKQPVKSDVLTGVSKVEQCINQSLLPQSDAPIVKEATKLSPTMNAEANIKDVDCIVGEMKDSKPVEGASFDANYKDCGDAVPSDIKLSAYENNLQTDLTAAIRPENEVEGVDVSQASQKCDFANIASHDANSSAKYVGQDASVLKPHENMIDSSGLFVLSTHEESSAKLDAASMGVSQTAAICQDSVIVGGVEESLELQAGYDSQFEDGELREPDVQLWDEIEQVDYDTEGEEERHSCKQSDTSEKKLDMGSVSNAADRLLRNGNIEGGSMDLKIDNGNISDGSRIKVDTVHAIDELHAGTSDIRLHGTKASPEGVRGSRCSGFDDSCSIAERDRYPDRYVERERAGPRLCGRSPGNGRPFNRSNAHWNSRQQHSPVRQDLYNPVRMRPRGAVESHEYVMATDGDISDVAGVSRTGQRLSRQFLPTSNGAYRPHMRRRSPLAREESYGMQSRMTSLRESNPDGRSIFRRYTQNGGRGDYVKHIADSTEYFDRMTHRLGRRERSGSPNGGRLHYAAYRGSRSRSRSRSPMPWLHQRGRNEGSSHRSRSPNFKSGAGRMDRLRMMFPKRFASDYKEGFMPAARSRVSPPRDNRLFDERNTDFDHLRSRKSPVRMFRQTQRFDSMRSSRSPSPMPWYQRDRNEASSHRSRSPNFKSDGTRMGRGRMMFQKRFTSNYKDGFVPGPRNVSSPHANRSFEDRNIDFDNFRSRTSPGRMFRQNHRFDSGRSGRRPDADDHLRPMIRPRRFTDMSASGKGGKYEDGEDDRSRGSRQCETTDGTVRQCQQQIDKTEAAAAEVAAVVAEEC